MWEPRRLTTYRLPRLATGLALPFTLTFYRGVVARKSLHALGKQFLDISNGTASSLSQISLRPNS
jgi:hypothetical protein